MAGRPHRRRQRGLDLAQLGYVARHASEEPAAAVVATAVAALMAWRPGGVEVVLADFARALGEDPFAVLLVLQDLAWFGVIVLDRRFDGQHLYRIRPGSPKCRQPEPSKAELAQIVEGIRPEHRYLGRPNDADYRPRVDDDEDE